MLHEPMSDYCNSKDYLDLIKSSNSDTSILSETDLEVCFASTSQSSITVDTSFWT